MPGKYLVELPPAMFLYRQTLATKVPQRLYKYLPNKEFLGGIQLQFSWTDNRLSRHYCGWVIGYSDMSLNGL